MKIFVSSTYEDLKEYRRAVRDAILRLGHQPIGMEDFGSRPEEWNKAALKALEGCDALVGIYAHRYGSVPSRDSLSITEQEFNKARDFGIECFCYVIDPNQPWQKQYIDRGRAEKNLQQFLKKKVNALLRSTFTTRDDLASKVSADLGRELGQLAETKLQELSAVLADNNMLCPYCGALLDRREYHSQPREYQGREYDVEQEYIRYECGLEMLDGKAWRNCNVTGQPESEKA